MLRTWLRVAIGILDVLGAATGIALTAFDMTRPTPAAGLGIAALFLTLFGFGIVSGILLLRAHPAALPCNRVYWLLQAPAFASPYLTYAFAAGLAAPIWLQLRPLHWGIEGHVGAMFMFYIGGAQPVMLAVNLFALALAVLLIRARRLGPVAASSGS